MRRPPLFTVLLAHFLTADERLNWHKGLGVVIGIAGVAVVIGPDAWLDGPMLGKLAVVAATISYAFAGIFGKLMTHYHPVQSPPACFSAQRLCRFRWRFCLASH